MHRHIAAFFFALLLLAPSAPCATMVLDFEGFPDSTILSNQYTGVTFSNAAVLKSGISLNEVEFPPHSGSNAASDNGGALSITLASPATSFGGYFTYLLPLTLTAFNSANTQVASVSSKFADNLACLAGPPCSGNAGSSANELLSVSFAAGISKVTIKGDPNGGSFVLDDATITTPTGPTVPEPASIILILSGLLVMRARVRKL